VRLHRLLALLLLLECRGQLKARELAEALETSERTIHRDLATLCEAGILCSPTILSGHSRGISFPCEQMVSCSS